MNIKRRFFRWVIKARHKHTHLSLRENQVIDIIKLLLQDGTTDLYYAPIDNTRYIKTQNSEMFVIIYPSSVVISNHNYFYDISISESAYDELHRYYDRVTNMRRKLMEKEMLDNVSVALDKIGTQLRENIKTQNENGTK